MAWPMSPSARAGLHRGEAALDGLVGDVDQPPGARARPSPTPYMRLVSPCQPSTMHGDVDVGDVAFAQRPLAGDAVADHVVGRDAQRLGVAAIEQAGGQGAVVEDELARQRVEVVGDHARADVRGQHVQALGGQPAGARACPRSPRRVWILICDPVRRRGSRSPLCRSWVRRSEAVPAYVAILPRKVNGRASSRLRTGAGDPVARADRCPG